MPHLQPQQIKILLDIKLTIYYHQLKPIFSLYSPYYANACRKFAVPISAIQRQGSTATYVHVSVMITRPTDSRGVASSMLARSCLTFCAHMCVQNVYLFSICCVMFRSGCKPL